ncbi:type I restriction enzyme HsdR N-terminal domain-containing protein [Candidatus Karelsulcia muelleri]
MNLLENPGSSVKTMHLNGKVYVCCLIRKKYYILTKEELVRQQLISYLIKNRGYKVKEIYVEFKYYLQNMKKSIDIIVFKKTRPLILIECKASKISYKDFDQIMKYYLIFKSKYLVITNGMKNIVFGFQKNANDIEFFKKIPKNS